MSPVTWRTGTASAERARHRPRHLPAADLAETPARPAAAVVLAGLALGAALLFSILDFASTPEPRAVAASPARDAWASLDLADARPVDTSPDADAPAPLVEDAPPRRGAVLPVERPPALAPHDVPFKVLGTLPEPGGDVVVLYGRGRTLPVRGPGPLDDDYVVDAVDAERIVLREVRGGATHVLALGAPDRVVAPSTSPDDSPPD